MIEILIFLRDALVAVLLSWVGLSADKSETKEEAKPDASDVRVEVILSRTSERSESCDMSFSSPV